MLSAGKTVSIEGNHKNTLNLIITGIDIKRLHQINFKEAIGIGLKLRNTKDLVRNEMLDLHKKLSSDDTFDAVEIAVKNSFTELWNQSFQNELSWKNNPFVVIYDFKSLQNQSQ